MTLPRKQERHIGQSAGLSFKLVMPDGTIAYVVRGSLARVTIEGEHPPGWQRFRGDAGTRLNTGDYGGPGGGRG